MSDWLEELAVALEGRLRSGQRLDPVSGEKNSLLELARDVAHSTERKNAPLATFVAGRYVSLRVAQGVDCQTALDEVDDVVQSLLPEQR